MIRRVEVLTDYHADFGPILVDAHEVLSKLTQLSLFLLCVEDVGVGVDAVRPIWIRLEYFFEYSNGCSDV